MNPNDPYQTPAPQQQPMQGGFIETPPPQPQPYQTPPQYQPVVPPPTIQDQYNAVPPVNNFQQPYTPPPRNIQPQQSAYTPPPRPREVNKIPLPFRIIDWFKSNWYAPILGILGIVLLGDLLYQFAYPISALPQGLQVEGVSVGGMSREAAAKKLDDIYGKVKVDIFFGSSTVPYKTPTASEVGIRVHNDSRLKDVSYPLWLRFVPTSMMWAKDLVTVGQPVYDYESSAIDSYTSKNVGQDCYIKPQNASLKIDDGRFSVISAQPGGKCDVTKFKTAIKEARIQSGKFTIRTSIDEVDAPITDEIARQLGDELNHTLSGDKQLQAGGQTDVLPSSVIKGWLSFKAVIPEPKEDGSTPLPPRLTYVIEPERVSKYFAGTISSRVEKKPGVTKIATTDFTETSHVVGAPGVLIDMNATIPTIDSIILGRNNVVIVTTKDVPPTVSYTRTYTPTEAGYMALARQFGDDNGGFFGIKYQELSGKKPLLGGSYRQDQPFPAAGLEGVYLAYAAQAGIDDGSIQPTDKVHGSMDVTDCITEVITVQDKGCTDGLLSKMGNATVVARMKQIGMNHTDFNAGTITTTAGDLYTFTTALDSKTLPLKKFDKLVSAMRNVEMRDGFVAGTQSRSIVTFGGNKGGYNESIIANANGKYIVVIMSNQESGDMAKKFIQEVEKIHMQKQNLKS